MEPHWPLLLSHLNVQLPGKSARPSCPRGSPPALQCPLVPSVGHPAFRMTIQTTPGYPSPLLQTSSPRSLRIKSKPLTFRGLRGAPRRTDALWGSSSATSLPCAAAGPSHGPGPPPAVSLLTRLPRLPPAPRPRRRFPQPAPRPGENPRLSLENPRLLLFNADTNEPWSRHRSASARSPGAAAPCNSVSSREVAKRQSLKNAAKRKAPVTTGHPGVH